MPTYFSRALREVRSANFPLTPEMYGYLLNNRSRKRVSTYSCEPQFDGFVNQHSF